MTWFNCRCRRGSLWKRLRRVEQAARNWYDRERYEEYKRDLADRQGSKGADSPGSGSKGA